MKFQIYVLLLLCSISNTTLCPFDPFYIDGRFHSPWSGSKPAWLDSEATPKDTIHIISRARAYPAGSTLDQLIGLEQKIYQSIDEYEKEIAETARLHQQVVENNISLSSCPDIDSKKYRDFAKSFRGMVQKRGEEAEQLKSSLPTLREQQAQLLIKIADLMVQFPPKRAPRKTNASPMISWAPYVITTSSCLYLIAKKLNIAKVAN